MATLFARIATTYGAVVSIEYLAEDIEADRLEHLDLDQLARPSDVSAYSLQWSEIHVAFRAMLPPMPASARLDYTHRLAAHRSARGAISALRWSQSRWAIVDIPSSYLAQRLGCSLESLEAEFFAALRPPSTDEASHWAALAALVTASNSARIVASDTDLLLPLGGRKGVLFDGKANIPDGEVATAPLEHAVEGHIAFPGEAFFAGHLFTDLRLEFRGGRVSKIDATDGADVARALLESDAGSSFVGELGIGLNSRATSWTGDLLFDEKILGTVHIALGRAYPECGGVNQSSLHWDIVKDLRPSGAREGGLLLLDDVPVVANGIFDWESVRTHVGSRRRTGSRNIGEQAIHQKGK